MASVVGSLRWISLNGIKFPVAGDSDPSRDLGGYKNELMMNGDGTSRTKQEVKPWSYESLTVELDDDEGSQEYIQNLINNGTDVQVTVCHVDNTIYSGTGKVTGDLKRSTQSGTADITLSGGGELSKQA